MKSAFRLLIALVVATALLVAVCLWRGRQIVFARLTEEHVLNVGHHARVAYSSNLLRDGWHIVTCDWRDLNSSTLGSARFTKSVSPDPTVSPTLNQVAERLAAQFSPPPRWDETTVYYGEGTVLLYDIVILRRPDDSAIVYLNVY